MPFHNSGQDRDSHEAREYFRRTRDVKGTLDLLPHYMQIEKSVLLSLEEAGLNNFINAAQRVCFLFRMYTIVLWLD